MDTGGFGGEKGRATSSRASSKSHSRPSSRLNSPAANPLPASASFNPIASSSNLPPVHQPPASVYARQDRSLPLNSSKHWDMTTVLDDGTNDGKKWKGPGSCDFCKLASVRCVRRTEAPPGSRCALCEKENVACSLAESPNSTPSLPPFASTHRPSTGGRKRSSAGIERSSTNPSNPSAPSALSRPPYNSSKSLPAQLQLQSDIAKRPRLSNASSTSSKDKGKGRERRRSGEMGSKDQRIAEMQRSLVELMKAVEEAIEDDEGNASSSSEDSETETARMGKEYRMSLYDPNSTSLSSLLNSPDPTTRSQQQLLVSVCKSLKQKDVELNERRALDAEMKRTLEEKEKLAHEWSRRSEIESRSTDSAGRSERVKELERELEKMRLGKEGAETEARRCREEKDQAVERGEEVGRSRDGILEVSRKRELEMGKLRKEMTGLEIELGKVRNELANTIPSGATEIAALNAHREKEETALKADVASKNEEIAAARGRISIIEEELQQAQTRRDAAVQSSAILAAEIERLKSEKALVETDAQAKLPEMFRSEMFKLFELKPIRFLV
ncbi:hypothetical protein BDY24DRAFT_371942 [Mrakia frigida]|uniref:uncharacterized protein n=1 Tax=Mrakia frigida TaxID=29902 RepID=UPI003FCBF797